MVDWYHVVDWSYRDKYFGNLCYSRLIVGNSAGYYITVVIPPLKRPEPRASCWTTITPGTSTLLKLIQTYIVTYDA